MVVFMSSDYEKDEHCRSLFFHAINTSKPITVVAVGKNLDWTKTDLGLMIGDEVWLIWSGLLIDLVEVIKPVSHAVPYSRNNWVVV